MKQTAKYMELILWLSLIVIFITVSSSIPGKNLCTSPLFRKIHEKDIDASALFYTESDYPVNSARKLEQRLNQSFY